MTTRHDLYAPRAEEGSGLWGGPKGITASVTVGIFLLIGLGIWAIPSAPTAGLYGPARPFPEIRNWQSLDIELQRGGCLGTCPWYSANVTGDGTVTYVGKGCVAEKGKRQSHISVVSVAGLVQEFRNANYFSLRDYYVADITDAPTFQISISFDGRRKIVGDYEGEIVGMPSSVRNLESEIDRVAGTGRWVFGKERRCFGQLIEER